MRIGTVLVTLALSIAAAAGCGGDASTAPGSTPPHGGTLTPLPDGKGVLEHLTEAEALSAPSRKKGRVRVVAYFLNESATGPPAETPRDVVFTDAEGKPHKLAPASGEGPGARFETDPYVSVHDASGDFTFQLGSRGVTLPVRAR